jgi:hypothetical protein
MTNLLIQVDANLSDEFTGAFPQMVARHHSASTTLVGKVADQQEMLGVMNLLVSMGVDVLLMLRIPDI